MAKKFKDDFQDTGHADMGINLLGYISQHAPDILKYLPVMAGDSAITFWAQTFQPAMEGEGKRLGKTTVIWPYADRLIYLARIFITLDDRFGNYIIKAAKVKIWWRGDECDKFRRIVDETLQYRELNDEEKLNYRKRAMLMANTFMSRNVLEKA